MSSTKTASYLVNNNTNSPVSSSASFSASYNLNQGVMLNNMIGGNGVRNLMTPSPLSIIHSNYAENVGNNNSIMNSIAENIHNNNQHFHNQYQYELLPPNVNGYNKFLPSSSSSFTPHLLYNNGISQHHQNNTKNDLNHNQQKQQQQCGICHKEPMINGKTLIGCLHSFCQLCLIQSQTFLNNSNGINNSLSSHSSIITCPICYQETLMPNGGIDALMPHYSNPLLLNDLLDETSSSLMSPSTSFMLMNNSNNQDLKHLKNQTNNNGYQNFTSSNGLLTDGLSLISSSVSNDSNTTSYDIAKHKNFTQQQLSYKKLVNEQQQRLIKIENDINKTYSYYVQVLNERRDSLIKEFQAIVQFVQKQNQNKLLMNDVNVDCDVGDEFVGSKTISKGKKSTNEKLNGGEFHEGNNFFSNSTKLNTSINGASENDSNSSSSNDMQSLINSHLMAIEFVSNYANIQGAVRNSFGYIRYNQSGLSNNITNNNNNSYFDMSNLSGDNHSSNGESSSTTEYLIEQFVSNINSAYSGSSSNHNTNGKSNESNFLANNSNNNSSSQNNKTINTSFGPSNSLTNLKNPSLSSSTTTPATTWSAVVKSTTNTNSSNSTVNSSNQSSENNHQSLLTSSSSYQISLGINSLDDVGRTATPNFNASSLMSKPSSKQQHSSSCSSSSTEHQTSVNEISNEDPASLSASQILQSSTSTATSTLPARSQIKRTKMIYNCKFGEFGVTEGQFTEPSGVAVNAQNDIVVADTNSHRIQIFDKEGRFKFKFGECGKREGQLLYPNRVSVVKQTGEIVVTERSPTHQIQIYNQYGHFLRKFGANILQHPRGVCVDSKSRIIVVECKVMRVIIFDLMGNILQKFNCSKYLEFPNGCCCSHNREEIFISDNRAHCIKVFNYEGQYMRQIGGEGITNYPIGVGINLNGEVLVADNHNNFNLTVFTQDGDLITALESKVKHAQCFDVGLMDDGSIVLASKDYRIYVYKYNSSNSDATTTPSSSLVVGSNNHSSASANAINNANSVTSTFNNF